MKTVELIQSSMILLKIPQQKKNTLKLVVTRLHDSIL